MYCFVFFFNDTATTEIYTLSLHDALPIYAGSRPPQRVGGAAARPVYLVGDDLARRGRGGWQGTLDLPVPVQVVAEGDPAGDRKSTRLNSSHANISYAVFCLKKKKKQKTQY